MKVGIIGCGNISQAYFNASRTFPVLEVVACADINLEAARAKAAENKVEALTVEELLERPDIEAVINLTIPAAHADVSLRALAAGKHVHGEKPLATSREDGRKILALAKEKGLRVGCAPDTFLGAGLQTCRKLIDDGWIGRPFGGTAFMMGRGPESWHPNPAFFYQRGAGPMFDMGPYYLTALVHLLGPVKSVAACVTKAHAERVATCKEQYGKLLPVEVPTHLSGSLLFHNGAVVTVTISFDVWKHTRQAPIEIYGTAGSLQVPDPNTFKGPVRLFTPGSDDWKEMPLSHGYAENMRSIGLADLATALHAGRPHRCCGDLAFHVLDIMSAFEESSLTGRHIELESSCAQPAPLPMGLLHGTLD
ncbi:MAG: Gfo/Idh/MocA family oxidoreductase [Lentisphaeria bacterium]|jgi:predicted dehydrogenase